MRILILNHEFPPIGGGGGKVAEDIAQGLVERGHEVLVLTSHYKSLPKTEGRKGVQIRRFPTFRSSPYRATLLSMGMYVGAGIFHGLKAIARWKPDVMHIHFAVPAGALGWILNRLTGKPYLLTVHLGDVPGGTPEKTGRWFRWVYPFTPPIWKGAARIVAVSQFTRDLARQTYPLEMDVIPNGVDTRQVNPGAIQVHEPPQIVFAGRFEPQKNPLQLVNVLSKLQDLPWGCVMLGDGSLKPTVEQEVRRQGLQSRISLRGWVEPEDVLAEFARSDILFMPSRSEGLPVVGVQALAMGLAMVAGKVGGFVEVVQPGVNGSLFDPDDAPGMEAELRRLLSDPQALVEARLASRRLSARFDLTTIVDRYETAFKAVVG